MKQLNKGISALLFSAVGIVLAVISGRGTWSFAVNMFPAEKALMGLGYLAAFDVAMLAWLMVYINYADGKMQRGLSVVMTVAAFLANAYVFYLNMSLFTGRNAVASDAMIYEARLFLVGVVFAHIGAAILFNVFSPKIQREMQEAETMSEIWEKSFEYLKENTAELAAELGSERGKQMVSAARYRASLQTAGIAAPQIETQSPDPAQLVKLLERVSAQQKKIDELTAAQRDTLRWAKEDDINSDPARPANSETWRHGDPAPKWLESVIGSAAPAAQQNGVYQNGHAAPPKV